jgi:hypothetical protein
MYTLVHSKLFSAITWMAIHALFLSAALAQPISVIEPDELLSKSDTVIIGKVASTAPGIGTRQLIPPVYQVDGTPQYAALELSAMEATVFVLSQEKGKKLPRQISIRYYTTPGPIGHSIENYLMRLKEGQRYRFYLHKTDSEYFVTVLNGHYVEAQASLPITDDEPDDSRVLISREARDIALKECGTLLNKSPKKLEVIDIRYEPFWSPPSWFIQLKDDENANYNVIVGPKRTCTIKRIQTVP